MAVHAADPSPADAQGHSLHALLAELQRRNVLKVVGAYLVGMWIVLQVAETTFEPLHLPAWWMTALTILAVVGLPIVTVLAWSYEITAALDGTRENTDPLWGVKQININIDRINRGLAAARKALSS